MVRFVMKKQVFRPTARSWLSEVIGPIVLLWALFAAWWFLNAGLSIVYVMMVVLGTLVLAINGLSLARNRLEVDSQGLRGRLGGVSFDILWHDVLAVRLVARKKQQQDLLLGLADRGVLLSLKNLDTNAVMRALVEVAPGRALESDAFNRLTWVAYQQVEHAALLAGADGPVRIRVTRYVAVFGWLGLAMFGFFFLWWSDETLGLRLAFLGFTLLAVFVLYIAYAIIEVLPDSVRLIMPLWPTFAMRWDEVARAETDQDGNQIVLHSPGKRMTLPGPKYWRRPDQESGGQAFFGHLERVNVPVRTSAAAAYKLPKGTRVSRS